MQLIFDTETVDIKEKMSSLEESSEKSFNDGIEPLKAAISNGNKENIQCAENIIKGIENVTNGIDKDDINDGIEIPVLDDGKILEDNEKILSADAQDNSDSNDVKTNGTSSIIESDKQDSDHIDKNIDSTIEEPDKKELIDIHESMLVDANVENSLESKNDAPRQDDKSKVESDVENVSEEVNDSQMAEAPTEETVTSETFSNDVKSSELLPVTSSPKTLVNIGQEETTENDKIEQEVEESKMEVNNTSDSVTDESKVYEENPVATESFINVHEDDLTDSSKINEDNPVQTESFVNLPENFITESSKVNEEIPIEIESSVNIQGDDIDESSKINEENVKETNSSANLQVDDINDSLKINEENPKETESSVTVQGVDITDSAKINEENPKETDTSANVQDDDITDPAKIDEENLKEAESSVNVQSNDITDSSKMNDENPVDTEMEVDVSQPELSTMECDSLNENDMECSDTIEKNNQSTSLADEEKVMKLNTDNQSVIDEVKNNVVNPSVIETEIVNALSHGELIEKSPVNNENAVLEKSYNENILPSLNVTESVSGKDDSVTKQGVKVMDIDNAKTNIVEEPVVKLPETAEPKKKVFCKLSNTLDILSDDEDDVPTAISNEKETLKTSEKQCINIEDDDDIMLIDEDVASKDCSSVTAPQTTIVDTTTTTEKRDEEKCAESTTNLENNTEHVESVKTDEPNALETKADPSPEKETTMDIVEAKEEKPKDIASEIVKVDKPLLPANFLKAYKKNLSEMTREDLEEFCILKIVESIVDRSNLSDIKTKLKEMAQNIEEHKKKALMLTKQNRDLQVVVKSVQEEQKKFADNPAVIKPLKITRSVGMQVLVNDKPGIRKKSTTPAAATGANTPNNRNPRAQNQNPKLQKSPAPSQPIPVPRLVPANNAVGKISAPTIQSAPTSTQVKTPSPAPNGIRNSPPVQKIAEKRPISRIQSVTVDLTDDEPPTKIAPKSSPAPPVRLVSPQNLLATRPPFGQTLNSPRKVYIPISGPQNPGTRPGAPLMLKSVAAGGPGVRPRLPPHIARMPQNTIRMPARGQSRHPAPLPDAVKQYQPPNWKALPPAPDLKLSKVENGIVISWKIEGYQDDSYEEIASYQLYAYQETSSPPSTALWKKIGDVKALPLPMACTLTHVMAGFKYYFAVRAVDIRSRLGPFSLPGSILLLNKL